MTTGARTWTSTMRRSRGFLAEFINAALPRIVLAAGFLAEFITLIVKTVLRPYRPHLPRDNYTVALHKALQFFNAQRCWSWRNFSRADS
ncbi:endoglucanase 25-like [Actinidia eriantha]|uniref:endoglucanase 25-like n=1 Tax=Actinidia eriantha TaxID=165200 RepID=UPI00258A37E0|nr:endoglucanase 25-like [Actinidia eriantha]